jgi:hypothetical protein
MVAGPAVGGAVYAIRGADVVYGATTLCSLIALAFVATLEMRAPSSGKTLTRAATWGTLLDGVHYVRRHPVVLGAMSVDLFAVLLGGAVALLPPMASDVLHVGPSGLGALRSAPALGAAIMGLVLAFRPVERRAGRRMLWSVVVFGLATIGFGLSKTFESALGMLAIVGAADMVSVYVRSSIIQLATPDSMRGRVSAVNVVFITSSNELGEFESGLTAQWLDTVPAIVIGGVGTLIAAGLCAWRFPDLRRIDRPTDVIPTEA